MTCSISKGFVTYHGSMECEINYNYNYNYNIFLDMPHIGPSAIQSGTRTKWFPLVSSPKETSGWEKFWWRWVARKSHDVVQRAGGRLLGLRDIKAGSKT